MPVAEAPLHLDPRPGRRRVLPRSRFGDLPQGTNRPLQMQPGVRGFEREDVANLELAQPSLEALILPLERVGNYGPKGDAGGDRALH
jgi:hypothetical protein